MNLGFCLPRFLFIALACVLLSGCLLRPKTVSTRHFVLAPISTDEPASRATKHTSIGIGFVKMPAYLLRSAMAIRNGANEIEYLEDARWGERLDQCFQQTLAANLSRLLSSDGIYLTDWGRGQVMFRVFVNFHQFDVDTRGNGILIAQWRISAPDSDLPLKSNYSRLTRTGIPPGGKPELIASILSDLTAEFSRNLAQSLNELAGSNPEKVILGESANSLRPK